MREIDQHLKERLVGAAVLVIIGVLVIPALLDGPPPDEPVRVDLELPTSGKASKSHTIRLDVPADRPATPASGSIARPEVSTPVRASAQDAEPTAAEATQPAPPAGAEEAQQQPAPRAEQPKADQQEQTESGKPAAAAAAPRAASDMSGGWVVQLGSFSSEDNAARLSQQLRDSGYDVFVSRISAEGKTMHRVRVGPVPKKADAELLASKLKADGHPGQVMPGDK